MPITNVHVYEHWKLRSLEIEGMAPGGEQYDCTVQHTQQMASVSLLTKMGVANTCPALWCYA